MLVPGIELGAAQLFAVADVREHILPASLQEPVKRIGTDADLSHNLPNKAARRLSMRVVPRWHNFCQIFEQSKRPRNILNSSNELSTCRTGLSLCFSGGRRAGDEAGVPSGDSRAGEEDAG